VRVQPKTFFKTRQKQRLWQEAAGKDKTKNKEKTKKTGQKTKKKTTGGGGMHKKRPTVLF